MIGALFSRYSWRYPSALVYMLQNTEYQAKPYLVWYWKTRNFSRVMYRRQLDKTRAARLLLLALRIGMALQIIAGLLLLARGYYDHDTASLIVGIAILLTYPLVWAHAVVLPLIFGRWLIVVPRQRKAILNSEATFKKHPGMILAVVGSYGKTSMKELLLAVLSDAKKVAATPANKNVAISHANFARTLSGDEDVVIIEYGEGAPGDVARFARITHPTHAVITGVAPAHLDHYKTVERAADDIFSVTQFVAPEHVFVNSESTLTHNYISGKPYQTYSRDGALGWKITDVKVAIDGTSFSMSKAGRALKLQSGLLGAHQVGPLAFAAALAAELGMTDRQIQIAIAKTTPYEHRMQPYNLGGAWIIDDTYNGNIEGIRAGTQLLKSLPAKRKIYVTPGLVDQGAESNAVHEQMGALIADANPDIVVLMQNSAAPAIQRGLQSAGFTNQALVQSDPLAFYTNLQAFVAAGDVVLMQNDWTDNYL